MGFEEIDDRRARAAPILDPADAGSSGAPLIFWKLGQLSVDGRGDVFPCDPNAVPGAIEFMRILLQGEQRIQHLIARAAR
ncbi:MAG: hypothetical protein WDN76_12000 [Alphaproteobacteria bacterium]